jgi:phenylpropionate dioxygenase-like ring-hydroxylating dioxygenase large terminal subunit
LGDEDVSETWRRGSDSVFQQDVDALNAQEKRLACLPPDHVELSIVGDAAALASRKMIRARLRTEREEAAPSGV